MGSEANECLVIGVGNRTIDGKDRLIYHFRRQQDGEIVKGTKVEWPASGHDIPADPASIDSFEEWAWREVPDDVAKSLRDLMANSLAEEKPTIWIHYDRPRAHLALVPWEMLLQPVFDCPVLKLPPLELPPTRLPGRPVYAICGSVPAAKSAFGLVEIVERSVRRFLEAVRTTKEVHVFVDEGHVRAVKDVLRAHDRPGLEIIVHDPNTEVPDGAPDRDPIAPDTGGEIVNPWMVWIADALAGKRVDAISFCCHGYYNYERGAISFAESPRFNTDIQWSRFVAGEELAGLLDTLGARFLVLESPERNFSATGLLATADLVAQLRPGPVAVHDSASDPELDALLDAFDHVLGLGWNRRPASPSICLSVSPSEPRSAAEAVRSVVREGYRPTKAPSRPQRFPTRGGVLKGNETSGNDDDLSSPPDDVREVAEEYGGWVAASRRRVERSWAAHRQHKSEDSEVAAATQAGVANALTFIETLMSKHGGNTGGSGNSADGGDR